MNNQEDCRVYYLDEAKDRFDKIKNFTDEYINELVFHLISCLIKGGMPSNLIMDYIENIAILCDPLSLTQNIKDKIDKCIKLCLKDNKEISLTREVREYVVSTNGHFFSTDVYKDMHLSTRRNKKTVSQILSRLIKEGIIERYGNRNGCFRLIDKELDKIDWQKNLGEEIDISLPLNLNNLVKIYPGNLIVIAGMSNAGKTALLLNIVGLNLDKHKNNLLYFSSEMGPCELKTRLSKFNLPDEIWDSCIFYERSNNFADVIDKDKINIIDYFEISDNFWKIGGDFRNIYEKLDRGIVIIALQKDPEKNEGRGGSFSLEKPRLYLSLNEIGMYNELKIVKAKNWKTNKYNPNGLIKRFKIEDGYKLIELSNWG